MSQSSKRDERAAALQLAELLLGSEAEAETRETDGLLRKLEKRELVLPEYRFRHALASSRAAGRLGQKKRAREMARRALSLAEVQEVQLDRALRREIESFVIAGVHETSTHVGATRK